MSAWGSISQPAAETVSLADVMSEQYAEQLHNRTWGNAEKLKATTPAAIVAAEEPLPPELLALLDNEEGAPANDDIRDDATIAQMLQSQYDYEYNQDLRRVEKHMNQNSKVTLTLKNYLTNNDVDCHNDIKNREQAANFSEVDGERKDWDRFETNKKTMDAIPRCGFKLSEDGNGSIITKHNMELCGIRNAGKVMEFPESIATGDAAGFDMKLNNKVFNDLHKTSRLIEKKTKASKASERKDTKATTNSAIDANTRLIILGFINNQITNAPNGIVSAGKEAVILHAESDPNYCGLNEYGHHSGIAPNLMPKECAIKVYRTTLNDFKQRDDYIKDDYRFSKRYKKHNNEVIVKLWAEKEMHNLMRMKSAGLLVPDVVLLKKHVLVMSFVGEDGFAAPNLKDARLDQHELRSAYEQVIAGMQTMYNDARLVHADLNEYNILWQAGQCWFIDVAQSVEPNHPHSLEFLMRDCDNIVHFFTKRGLNGDLYNKEQLFELITGLSTEQHSVAILQRMLSRGPSVVQATAPNCYDEDDTEPMPTDYPFDFLYEKTVQPKTNAADVTIDTTVIKPPTESGDEE